MHLVSDDSTTFNSGFIPVCFFCICLFFNSLSAWGQEMSEYHDRGEGVDFSLEKNALRENMHLLAEGSYQEKIAAIDFFSESDYAGLSTLLTALLDAHLFYDKKTQNIVKIQAQGNSYQLSSFEDSGVFSTYSALDSKSNYKKIRINNRIRRHLQQKIALLRLDDPDPDVRETAVTSMFKNLDQKNLLTIAQYREKERDTDVLALMEVALAVGDLASEDKKKTRAAIDILGHSLAPVALNTLREFEQQSKDKSLTTLAVKAIKRIEVRQQLFSYVETLYFGLSFGSVLVLAGIGLAITFGVMGVINMAHGELIMLGAYTTYVIQQLMPHAIGLSILVAIPAAFLVSGLIGVIMERLVIRHLYGRPLETLLATFGISLILQQSVRTLFSPLNRSVITPDWMSGALSINSIFSLTWNRLYIIIFCVLVFSFLWLLMKKSALGLQVRAVSQNRMMARAMGVRSVRVDMLTFGLGSGIAGVAGVALSLLGNVGPNMGQGYIIDSFIVVVFGGVGNLFGTVVSGMSLGVMNKLMEPMVGAVLAKVLLLVFIILFIQKHPQGLFPQRGRAVEN